MRGLHPAAHGIVACALLIIAGMAQATTYTVRELPVEAPPSKDPYQTARSIDAQGHVLVNVQVVRKQTYFFMSERCRLQLCRQLTPRAHSNDRAETTLWFSMNDAGSTAGQVWTGDVGWAARRIPGQGVTYLIPGIGYDVNLDNTAVGATDDVHPFLYDTSLHLLPTPSGGKGRAYAINDHGVVAGEFYLGNGDIHPFIYENGVSTDLTPDAPRYVDGGAADINNAGVAVGCTETKAGGPAQAVRFERGRVIPLGSLIAGTRAGTCAVAINESGRLVVGNGDVDPLDATKRHGFVHDDSGLHDLNDLLRPVDAMRYMIYGAMDVNDAGQIAAEAVRLSDGAWLAVRLDPAP